MRTPRAWLICMLIAGCGSVGGHARDADSGAGADSGSGTDSGASADGVDSGAVADSGADAGAALDLRADDAGVDSATCPAGGCPASCAAYRAAHPTTMSDGDYPLFLGGLANRPFQAYCADMSTSPLTYLSLPNQSDKTNVSSYDATTVGTTTVVTRWMRVRFDSEQITIIPSDFRFSMSTGSVTHEMTTQVPYGVARDCSQTNMALGTANVDLRGLPFAVNPNWTLGGYVPLGSTTISAFNQVVSLTGGGSCGWNAPGGDRLGGTPIPLRWCPAPSTELCDGVDNDCDGVIDNGC